MKLFKKKDKGQPVRFCNCGIEAVVVCTTYDGEKIYLCSECLRSIRFRERDLFASIKNYGDNY